MQKGLKGSTGTAQYTLIKIRDNWEERKLVSVLIVPIDFSGTDAFQPLEHWHL